MKITHQTKTCLDCGAEFQAPTAVIFGIVISASRCDTCADRDWEQLQRAIAIGRGESKKPSPEEAFCRHAETQGFRRYLGYDPALATGDCRRAIAEFSEDSGRLFFGPTSCGKTFAAVAILRSLAARRMRVRLVDAVSFGMAVGQPDSARREAEMTAAIECDWLLFDDLGKVSITPRVAEGLFHVAKMREDRERNTIWTSNATGSDLRSVLPPEIADPFVERLRRSTKQFAFHSKHD